MSKVPTIFEIYKEEIVVASFMFYCYAKHSDILRGFRHVYCYWFPCTARLCEFSA